MICKLKEIENEMNELEKESTKWVWGHKNQRYLNKNKNYFRHLIKQIILITTQLKIFK